MTREEAIHQLQFILDVANHDDCNSKEIDAFDEEAINMAIKALEQEQKWIPVSEKYEHHIDHTDCIWYPNGSKMSSCAQYRDGWNDAMDYIFMDGVGYNPFCRGR